MRSLRSKACKYNGGERVTCTSTNKVNGIKLANCTREFNSVKPSSKREVNRVKPTNTMEVNVVKGTSTREVSWVKLTSIRGSMG